MAPVLAMPLILVGGLYVNSGTMPVYLRVIQQISPVFYSFSAIANNEWAMNTEQSGFYSFLALELTYWECILRFIGLALLLHIISMIMLKILISRVQ